MKKLNKKLTVLTAAGMMLFNTSSIALAAQEQEEQTFDLEQIVVTATKTEKKVKDIPASVTVITAEDLHNANIKTIEDALQNVPGIYIKGASGIQGTKISVRGLSQNRVLIMLDGLALNNGYTGGTQLPNIPVENIDRIEVIRGPFSALYGSSAMGGVINIITKQNAAPQTTVTIKSGQQGSENYALTHNNSVGKLEYYIDMSKRQTDGYITNPAKPQEGNFGNDNKKYDLKFIYHVNDTDKISLAKGRADYKYSFDGNNINRGQRITETLNFNYQTKLSPDKELSIHWGELNFSNYWTITGNKFFNPNPTKTNDGLVNLNWKINDVQYLTIGASTKIDQGNGQTYNILKNNALVEQSRAKTKTNSFYFQDELKLNNKTTLLAGGRYDKWNFYNGYNQTGALPDKSLSNFSPKASISYKSNNQVSWYASIGKSFVSPNMFQLVRNWPTKTGTLFANPDLKPEKATSYEIGNITQLTPSTTAKIALFRNNVDDMICQLDIDGKNLKWDNIGQARITGVEVELNHRFNPALTGFINYTNSDPKVTANKDANLVGKQIPTVPKEMLNLGLTYCKEKVTFNTIGRYVSRAYESNENDDRYDPHFVVDTKLTYRLDSNTEVSLAVDNLLDRQYYLGSSNSPCVAPSRTVFVEMTRKF